MQSLAPVLLLLAGCASSPLSGFNQALRFPDDLSVDNYVMLTPDMSPLQYEFSMCSWVKFSNVDVNTHIRYWFSYATSAEMHNMLVFGSSVGVTRFYDQVLGGWNMLLYVADQWQNICFTWDAESRIESFYLNGELKSFESSDPTHSLLPGGTIVLGQDQDTVGGGFALTQAFAGEIYGLQLLPRALSGEEVSAVFEAGMCASSTPLPGSLLSWSDFLGAERHGDVEVASAGCTLWDTLMTLRDEKVSDELLAMLDDQFV